jgi:crotonobetainyl-CoA:carnitine CoA-transferase CaiB-like acyl-CoA transferase
MLDDDQVVANEMAVDLEHTLTGQVRMAGPLAKMSRTPLRAEAASPALGEHTDEILGSLGYSAERIRSLKDTGVSR